MQTNLIGITYQNSDKIYDFLNVDNAVVGDEVCFYSKNGKKLNGTVVRTATYNRNALPLKLSEYRPAFLS